MKHHACRYHHLAPAGLAAAFAILAGCAGGDEPVRIGAVLPLSGDAAVVGESQKEGATLAVEELAARHEAGDYPYPVELVVGDSEGDPRRAGEELARLFKDGAAAALGGSSDEEALALVPIADREHRVVVTTASTPELSGASRYVYRLSPSATAEANKMAGVARLELGIERVGVLALGRPAVAAADAFAKELERQGGTVAAREDTVSPSLAGGALDAVLAPEPQALFVAGPPNVVAESAAEARESGFRGPILTTASFAAPATLQALEGLDGLLLTRLPFDPDADEGPAGRFAERYEERFGHRPGLAAAQAYDAVHALAAALGSESGRPADAWKGLRALQDHEGATGYVQFDQNGDLGAFPRVYTVRDGELRPLRELSERDLLKLARAAGVTGPELARVGG